MKILILVLSYNDNGGIYSKFFETQKKTWDSLEVGNVETYYYFGNNNKNEILDNIIKVNAPESYHNCTPKTIESMKLIKDYDFDLIFRTNSSSYINKEKLLSFAEKNYEKKMYQGILGYYGNITFASGSGYFIDREVMNIILDNYNKINQNYIDDVALADFLIKYNIVPKQSERYQMESHVNDTIPTSYFHYRFSNHRQNDNITNMEKLHKLILESRNIK